MNKKILVLLSAIFVLILVDSGEGAPVPCFGSARSAGHAHRGTVHGVGIPPVHGAGGFRHGVGHGGTGLIHERHVVKHHHGHGERHGLGGIGSAGHGHGHGHSHRG